MTLSDDSNPLQLNKEISRAQSEMSLAPSVASEKAVVGQERRYGKIKIPVLKPVSLITRILNPDAWLPAKEDTDESVGELLQDTILSKGGDYCEGHHESTIIEK